MGTIRRAALVVLCVLMARPDMVGARSVVGGLRPLLVGVEKTYRDLRYEGVVEQTDWYTCGPAAAATLLSFYYGLDVDEAAVLEKALEEMVALGQHPAEGISALALSRALAHWGFTAQGYRLGASDLERYFLQGGLPLILHVTVPEPHYVVAVGLTGGHLVVADPSRGRRVEPFVPFLYEKGFSGVALLPLPPEGLAPTGRTRQQEVLQGARHRLALLASGGRGGL